MLKQSKMLPYRIRCSANRFIFAVTITIIIISSLNSIIVSTYELNSQHHHHLHHHHEQHHLHHNNHHHRPAIDDSNLLLSPAESTAFASSSPLKSHHHKFNYPLRLDNKQNIQQQQQHNQHEHQERQKSQRQHNLSENRRHNFDSERKYLHHMQTSSTSSSSTAPPTPILRQYKSKDPNSNSNFENNDNPREMYYPLSSATSSSSASTSSNMHHRTVDVEASHPFSYSTAVTNQQRNPQSHHQHKHQQHFAPSAEVHHQSKKTTQHSNPTSLVVPRTKSAIKSSNDFDQQHHKIIDNHQHQHHHHHRHNDNVIAPAKASNSPHSKHPKPTATKSNDAEVQWVPSTMTLPSKQNAVQQHQYHHYQLNYASAAQAPSMDTKTSKVSKYGHKTITAEETTPKHSTVLQHRSHQHHHNKHQQHQHHIEQNQNDVNRNVVDKISTGSVNIDRRHNDDLNENDDDDNDDDDDDDDEEYYYDDDRSDNANKRHDGDENDDDDDDEEDDDNSDVDNDDDHHRRQEIKISRDNSYGTDTDREASRHRQPHQVDFDMDLIKKELSNHQAFGRFQRNYEMDEYIDDEPMSVDDTNNGSKKNLTEEKWENYGTAQAVANSRRRYYSQVQKINAHIMRVGYEGECRIPKPKIIQISEPSKRYVPHCTVLHRCSDDTGCCQSDFRTCVMKKSQTVELYFYVVPVGSKEPIVEALSFENHTECHCIERERYRSSSQLKRDDSANYLQNDQHVQPTTTNTANASNTSCQCAKHFTIFEQKANFDESAYQDVEYSGQRRCRCDCVSSDNACQRLKQGEEGFAVEDRKCILDKRCSPPTCEFGVYAIEHGRCPKNKQKRYIRPQEFDY